MHLDKEENPYYLNVSNLFQRDYDDVEAADKTKRQRKSDDCGRCGNTKGILSVIGGVMIYLSLGSVYSFGNMLPYFASYMASKGDSDYLDYVSQCNYIFAFTVAGQSIMFPIGGWLGAKIGYKWAILIGGAIQSVLGVMCTYFVCSQPTMTWITYGVLFGVGIGIAYPNILVVVMQWFPEHKGTHFLCCHALSSSSSFNFFKTTSLTLLQTYFLIMAPSSRFGERHCFERLRSLRVDDGQDPDRIDQPRECRAG